MSHGLQVWDANGKKVLDTDFTTVKTLKIIKGINQTTKNREIVFTHSLLAEQTPFYIIKPIHATYASSVATVSVYFKDNQCAVLFTGTNSGYDFSDYKIFVGVY